MRIQAEKAGSDTSTSAPLSQGNSCRRSRPFADTPEMDLPSASRADGLSQAPQVTELNYSPNRKSFR
jgi:hypothetical protein